MKKFVRTGLCFFVIFVFLSSGISAAEPSLLWDFGKATEEEFNTNLFESPQQVTWLFEEDYIVFTASGSDPYVHVYTDIDDVNSIAWAKIRVKNPSEAEAVELFAKTDGDGHALSGPECTHIKIAPNSNEWKEYIVYLPDANVETATALGDPISEWNWLGYCSGIRLDCMWQLNPDATDAHAFKVGKIASGSEIMIDYIAFFANEADAKAFRAEETPVVSEEAIPAVTTSSEPVTVDVPETTAVPSAPTSTASTAPQTSDPLVIICGIAGMSFVLLQLSRKRKVL